VATGAVVMARSRLARGHHGQGGLTLVEILIALAISAVIAGPIFGLLTVTLKARQPAQESNAAYSQFGLARVSLQRDWSRAEIVRVKPTGSPSVAVVSEDGLECNQAGSTNAYTAVNQGGSGNELLFSMQSAERYDGVAVRRRTVYVLRHTGTGQPKELVRRRCEREKSGAYPETDVLDVDAGGWRKKPGSMEFNIGPACSVPPTPPNTTTSTTSTTLPLLRWQTIDCGTQPLFGNPATALKYETVARNLTEVDVSNTCNTKADPTPTSYEPCDATVTFTAVGGETASIRLRQQAGRTYKEGP
jgi:prepilin-type N-terminal cleavage/methylation domain-containing protein